MPACAAAATATGASPATAALMLLTATSPTIAVGNLARPSDAHRSSHFSGRSDRCDRSHHSSVVGRAVNSRSGSASRSEWTNARWPPPSAGRREPAVSLAHNARHSVPLVQGRAVELAIPADRRRSERGVERLFPAGVDPVPGTQPLLRVMSANRADRREERFNDRHRGPCPEFSRACGSGA